MTMRTGERWKSRRWWVLMCVVIVGGVLVDGATILSLVWYFDTLSTLREAVLRDDVEKVKSMLTSPLFGPKAKGELFYARSPKMVCCLLSLGAEVNARDPEWGVTPLHFASGLGADDVVRALLERGAVADCGDRSSETPLHWTAREFNNIDTGFSHGNWPRAEDRIVNTASLLIAHGANVHAENSSGETPLLLAASWSPGLVNLLLEKGASARAVDHQGRTPLHEAVSGGDPETVRTLIAHGADVNAREWQGRTPMDCVNDRHPELIRILVEAGSEVKHPRSSAEYFGERDLRKLKSGSAP
jgi:ankyrin repeat protein